jgi:hypothetical protein
MDRLFFFLSSAVPEAMLWLPGVPLGDTSESFLPSASFLGVAGVVLLVASVGAVTAVPDVASVAVVAVPVVTVGLVWSVVVGSATAGSFDAYDTSVFASMGLKGVGSTTWAGLEAGALRPSTSLDDFKGAVSTRASLDRAALLSLESAAMTGAGSPVASTFGTSFRLQPLYQQRPPG